MLIKLDLHPCLLYIGLVSKLHDDNSTSPIYAKSKIKSSSCFKALEFTF